MVGEHTDRMIARYDTTRHDTTRSTSHDTGRSTVAGRTILRLDPRIPIVWRTPTSVQLGIDPPVVRIDDVSEDQERLLAALSVGVSRDGLAVITRCRPDERARLLRQVAPALLTTTRVGEPATIAVSGSDSLVSAVSGVLAGSGLRTLVAADSAELSETAPDLAVIAGHHVLAPEAHGTWLRRDVPHLPLVLGDAAAVVGPLIEPGAGPCLTCLELHRTDADPAWPAIASQLLGRRSRAESAVLVTEAAAAVGRLVLDRLREGQAAVTSIGTALRIDAVTGSRSVRQWHPHPRCGCLGIGSLVATAGRRGTGWASAARLALG